MSRTFAVDFVNIKKNFEMGERIGIGSYGQVYKVSEVTENNNNFNKFYALKVFIPRGTPTLITKTWLDEFSLLLNLEYPSIIKIMGLSKSRIKLENYPEQDYNVLLLDYKEKGDLSNLLYNRNMKFELTDQQKYIIILGLTLGMYYLHQHDVVHCDLKPQNILLDDNYYPYISDFGISKSISQLEPMSSNFNGGTPIYTAPEKRNNKDVKDSFKTDVYSYSLVLYEILTPKPTKGSKLGELYRNPDFRPEINLLKNDAQKKLIKWCWSAVPEERLDFKEIVKKIGKKSFIKNMDINIDEVKEYLSLFPEDDTRIILESLDSSGTKAESDPNIIKLKPTDDDKFDGIMNYLKEKSNGNLDNLVVVKSRSHTKNCPPINVINYNDHENPLIFCSNEEFKDNSIIFYFPNNFVEPSHYQIMTINQPSSGHHLRSWAIRGSNSRRGAWTVLDEKNDCNFLNGDSRSRIFKITKVKGERYCYISLVMTGPNWWDDDSLVFTLRSFELYGILHKKD